MAEESQKEKEVKEDKPLKEEKPVDHMAEMKKSLRTSPGKLRIITNMESPEGSDFPVTDPRHFVIHEVVEIEELENGKVMAHTEEGDFCMGEPEAVFKRLQEVSNLEEEEAQKLRKTEKE